MSREFREETSIDIPAFEWEEVATLNHPDYVVVFFKSYSGDLTWARPGPGETQELFVQPVWHGHPSFFGNARTALALAIDTHMKYPVTLDYHPTKG